MGADLAFASEPPVDLTMPQAVKLVAEHQQRGTGRCQPDDLRRRAEVAERAGRLAGAGDAAAYPGPITGRCIWSDITRLVH